MNPITKIRVGNRLLWPPGTPYAVKRKLAPSYNNKSLEGHFCDCGNPAELVKNNSKICKRCDEIEKRMGHMILRN